ALLCATSDIRTRARAASTRACADGSRPASFSGRRTFAATVAHGISVGSWNTKPMRCGAAASASTHSTVPLVGSLKPAMMRSAVDLPQPDGPSSDTNSPGGTSRSSRSRPSTAFAKVLPRRWSATTGATDAEGSVGTLQWSLHEARRQMLLPQSGFGHECDPALHLGGVKLRKVTHAEPGRLETDGAEFLPDVLLFDDLGDGRAEHGPRILRHLRMPIDAEPASQLDAGNTCLLEGRHVRDARQTIRAAHGEPFDHAGFDLLHNHRKHLDEQVDRAAHEVVERRRAAAIRHVNQLGAGLFHEQLDRE